MINIELIYLEEPILLNLNFKYSNGNFGYNYGGLGRTKPWFDYASLDLEKGELIEEVSVYEAYRYIPNNWRINKRTYVIVGVRLKTNKDQERLFGSNNGTKRTEAPPGYFLGYVQGKSGGFIDSLRMTWYKYTLKNASSAM